MGVNRQTLLIYWQHVRRNKPLFFVALIFIPIAALLFDTLLPYFLAQAIGGLVQVNESQIADSLVWAGVVATGGVVLNFLGFQALVRHESSVRVSLSDFTLQKLLDKDYDFFSNQKIGALTSRFIDFTRAYVGLQDLFIIRTLTFVISVTVGLAIVGSQAPLLALVLFSLIVLLVIQVKIGLNIRAPYRHARKKMIGEVHGQVADVLTNNLIIKTFATEKAEEATISKLNQKFRRVYVKDFSLMSGEGTIRLAIMSITQIVAISVITSLVLKGGLSIALAIFALTYLQRISSQVFTLGEILNGYDKVLLEAAPMTEILQADTTIKDTENAQQLDVNHGAITLQNVSYTYADGTSPVIKNISLTIKAGQKIGLVGPSGSGKTTITRLLLRFADPSEGSILIDGQNIALAKQQSLRRNIAYVPQEPLLFHRSLRENIIYGDRHVTDADMHDAAKKAHALEFIEKLPQDFDTVVGERGVKLSGGQRQRIVIARAILKDAPIMILDEATSALDSESEKLIQASLTELMKHRTSIVIAHRLSTIQKMDRIIVLDDGAIIEDGSHAELLAHGGMYAQLWAHQSGGFIEE